MAMASSILCGKYSYGFNGQERETEINPSVTTAQFWEYDARTGRRWNIDPVDQISLSNYVCLSNNPIIMIDPLGNADYFNNNAVWIGSDGINDGKRLIVLSNATASVIQSAMKNNSFISMNRKVYTDILDLPTSEFMNGINIAYTASDATNNESYVVTGGSGKSYTGTSSSGSSANPTQVLNDNGETTETMEGHTHPPVLIPIFNNGKPGGFKVAGIPEGSSSATTKNGGKGDLERAQELNLDNPSMVFGYDGLYSLGDKISKLKTREEAVNLLGEPLLKKLNNPANNNVNLRVPLKLAGSRVITFYTNTKPRISQMSYSKFKTLVSKVRNAAIPSQTCK